MTETTGFDYSAAPPRDPTAVMGRRIGAWLIDTAIFFAISIFSGISGAIFRIETTEFATSAAAKAHCDRLAEEGTFCMVSGANADVFEFGGIGPILGLMAVGAVLTGLLPGLTGWSFGKLMVGLRVVDRDTFKHNSLTSLTQAGSGAGVLAGIGANLLRWLCWIIDSFPWFIPLVGLVTGLVSKGHRRVGDMAAKTLVIHKDDVGRPTAIPGVNLAAFAAAGDMGVPSGTDEPPVFLGTATVADQPPSSLTPPADLPPAVEPSEQAATHATEGEASEAADDPEAGPEPPVTSEDHETRRGQGAGEEPETSAEADDGESMPGVGSPHWDDARDTYIQWDPELEEWMEWSASQDRWIPISRQDDEPPQSPHDSA